MANRSRSSRAGLSAAYATARAALSTRAAAQKGAGIPSMAMPPDALDQAVRGDASMGVWPVPPPAPTPPAGAGDGSNRPFSAGGPSGQGRASLGSAANRPRTAGREAGEFEVPVTASSGSGASLGNGVNRPRLPGRPAGEFASPGKSGQGRASPGDGTNRARLGEPPTLRNPGSR